MPCTPFQSRDGKVFGFICTRGMPARSLAHDCIFCGAPATKLCDHKMPNGKTCNAPVCDSHDHHVHPDQDFCPPHKQEHS